MDPLALTGLTAGGVDDILPRGNPVDQSVIVVRAVNWRC